MKKIFFAAAALLFSANAMALDNEPEEGVTTVAFLGMNVSNIRGIYDLAKDGKLLDYNAKVGGTLGFKFDYVLPNAHGTYITAGLDWTMKGCVSKTTPYNLEFNGNQYTSDITYKYNLHYIEIPVRVGFRYNLDKKLGFYGEFGPYFAVGVGGKYRINTEADGTHWSKFEDEERYSAFKKSTSDTNFQRWDCGLGFRIGAEYNQHYNLILGCDWGLTDMYRDEFRDAMVTPLTSLPQAKNFNFTLAFGYRF